MNLRSAIACVGVIMEIAFSTVIAVWERSRIEDDRGFREFLIAEWIPGPVKPERHVRMIPVNLRFCPHGHSRFLGVRLNKGITREACSLEGGVQDIHIAGVRCHLVSERYSCETYVIE